jgi:H+/Cl- antiporter ClcA
MLWLSILLLAVASLFIGTVYASSPFIILCIVLIGILAIPYTWYFVRWIWNTGFNSVSKWWDNLDKDDEEKG